jgi:tRNA (mo5U34)-methyltransferase
MSNKIIHELTSILCPAEINTDLLYLDPITLHYPALKNLEKINELRHEKFIFLKRKCWNELIEKFTKLPTAENTIFQVIPENGVISVTAEKTLTTTEQENINSIIQLLKPWRKGPYSIFNHNIEAEWQSNLKWKRLLTYCNLDLANKTIADIGCSNGYYMFRAAELNPKCVIGFEPVEQNFFSFHLFQHYLRSSKLAFELLGVEHITLFPNFFDLIFCMGIIYHRRNPLKMLRNIYDALKSEGELILESLVIPGDDPTALFPKERYCQMPNVYFMPTAECLKNMLLRTGFKDVQITHVQKLSTAEQRKTCFSTEQSLEDWLTTNQTQTIEGYPAPWQAIITGRK